MLKTLDVLFYVFGGAAIIALAVWGVNHVKYLRVRAANRSRSHPLPAKFPFKSLVFLAVPILLVFAISHIMTSYCRAEVLNFLGDLPGDYKIYVNSQPAQETHKIIAALKEVTPQLGHHSHPTKMIRVEIQTDKGSLTLELGRDSGYPQEYWVFYPKYGLTSNYEIGRVTTPVFDEF